MAKYKGVVMGALAGTMIATVLAVLGNREVLINKIRNQTDDWADKARNVTENIFGEDLTISRRNRVRKTFVSGAILGLLVGMGSAALLTPKTGKQLRKDLSQRYQGVADRTQDIVGLINQNGYRKPLKKLSKVLSRRKRPARSRA